MQDVFELEPQTAIPLNSYILSYPHIASYMSAVANFSESDFVRGCHMVYGWMPTVLDLYPEPPNPSLGESALLLQKAKTTGALTADELESLAKVVNNSIVGASKLLHFVSPENFAIWDSKIYSFVHEQKPYNHRVNRVGAYLEYIGKLNELKADLRFKAFHRSVEQKIGYPVSAFRALELVMFLNPPIAEGR